MKVEGDVYTSSGNYDESKKKTSEGKVIETLIWDNGNLTRKETTYIVEGVTKESYITDVAYSNEPNIYKQYPLGLSRKIGIEGEWGLEPLYMIGLFGVGPVNLPSSISGSKYTYTLNENGTIATEDNYIYVYK